MTGKTIARVPVCFVKNCPIPPASNGTLYIPRAGCDQPPHILLARFCRTHAKAAFADGWEERSALNAADFVYVEVPTCTNHEAVPTFVYVAYQVEKGRQVMQSHCNACAAKAFLDAAYRQGPPIHVVAGVLRLGAKEKNGA